MPVRKEEKIKPTAHRISLPEVTLFKRASGAKQSFVQKERQSICLESRFPMLRSTRVIQLGKLLTKWKERAPEVLDVATAIAVPENNCLSQPRKADAVVPSLCTAVSTLLNTRNGELSIVQNWSPLFWDLEDVVKW